MVTKNISALLLVFSSFVPLFPIIPAAEAQTCRYAIVASGISHFVFNGVNDPAITLFRGFTYQFAISVVGPHPFWIKTVPGTSSANAYTNGVSGNGSTMGTITFAVPTNAPAMLFYNCGNHSDMTGVFNIVDPPPVAVLDAYLQGNDFIISSIGTNLLRVQVEALEDLVNGTWSPVAIVTNTFAGGTNTTFTSNQLVTNTVYMYRVKACCE